MPKPISIHVDLQSLKNESGKWSGRENKNHDSLFECNVQCHCPVNVQC